ncbi:MAG: acetylxylan esterase [Alkalispirochaeta sp.]
MPVIDMPLEELNAYRGSSPRPDDFDGYWNAGIAELDQLEDRGFNVEWRRSAFTVPYAECFDLYYDGVRGGRIHGRCVFPGGYVPGGAGEPAIPGLFRFHGYTGNAGDWSMLLPYAAAGIAVCAIDVRGQGGESTDPGGTVGNTLQGHIIRGIEGDPDDLLYRQVFLDTVAAVRVIIGLPWIDASRLGTIGASQGGALSIACAALEPRITHTWAVYPFLSDYRRVWDLEGGDSAYLEIRQWLKRRDPRHEQIDSFFTRLGYIDVQFLAERIRGDIVILTGLMDEICPPSSQFAVYNRLESARSRKMILYPDFGHDTLPDQSDMALEWFLAAFGIR